MRTIAEELWASAAPPEWGRQDRRAAATWVSFACANRELGRLCRPLRWRELQIRSEVSASLATARWVLARPSICGLVQDLNITVQTSLEDEDDEDAVPSLALRLAADFDVLIMLLAAVGDLRRLSILTDETDMDEDAEDARDAQDEHVWRLVMALSRVPRPGLVCLQLGQEPSGANGFMRLSASALGRVLAGAPRLESLELSGIELDGKSLEASAGARLPRLKKFRATLFCSNAVARELGRCLGTHTLQVNLIDTALETQAQLLGAALRSAPSTLSTPMQWHVDGEAGTGGDDGERSFRAWIRRLVSASPGVEAICSSSSYANWAMLNASAATHRDFIGLDFDTSDVAERLADPTYGRSLRELSFNTNERDPELEAICATRGISIVYTRCV